MPNFQVVSRERYGNKRWLRYTSYAFAMKDAVLPLALAELPKAIMTLPIGFIELGGDFMPVAIMGLQPEKNLFVAPDGRWIQSYIPAACRGYPFRLAKLPDGQQVLCFDEDSGLLSDGSEGELFFSESGEPAPVATQVFEFLVHTEQSRQHTAAACALLREKNLIKPWPLTVRSDAGEQHIGGLFQIDEEALNQLPAEDLKAVRDAGGLTVAYCQMLSMQHLPVLSELAEAHAKLEKEAQQRAQAQPIVKNGELDLEFESITQKKK